MTRLAPKEITIKKLFALSGNRCAFSGCTQALVDEHSNLIGQICHIEAAEPGGERYNEHQTDDERRHFSNLILLCANHHIVTNNVELYPVDILIQMKAQHEAQNRGIAFAPSKEVIRQARLRISRMHVHINAPQIQTVIGQGHAHIDQRGSVFTQTIQYPQNSRQQKSNKRIAERKKELEHIQQNLIASVLRLIKWIFPLVKFLLVIQIFLPIVLLVAEITDLPLFLPMATAPVILMAIVWYFIYPLLRIYLRFNGFEDLESKERNQIIRELKRQDLGKGFFSLYINVCIQLILKFDKR